MSGARTATALLGAGLLIVTNTACHRGASTKNPSEDQTAIVQPATGAPITVTGCLRAGDAPETYVLMSIQRGSTPETATYQLIGKNGVDFQGHIGQQVQLTGRLGTQAELASRAAKTTEPKAQGTSGTPSVQTETDLQVRALHVDSLTPKASSCQR